HRQFRSGVSRLQHARLQWYRDAVRDKAPRAARLSCHDDVSCVRCTHPARAGRRRVGVPEEAVLSGRYRYGDRTSLRPARGFGRLAKLLPRLLQRELAIADARSETLGECRRGVFAVSGDEFRERGEQAGLCQTVAVNAVEPRLRPSFLQIAERHALLIVVAGRIARNRWAPAG